jgi:hypothetical protein
MTQASSTSNSTIFYVNDGDDITDSANWQSTLVSGVPLSSSRLLKVGQDASSYFFIDGEGNLWRSPDTSDLSSFTQVTFNRELQDILFGDTNMYRDIQTDTNIGAFGRNYLVTFNGNFIYFEDGGKTIPKFENVIPQLVAEDFSGSGPSLRLGSSGESGTRMLIEDPENNDSRSRIFGKSNRILMQSFYSDNPGDEITFNMETYELAAGTEPTVTLDGYTNAMIDAAPDTSLVTKDWVLANAGGGGGSALEEDIVSTVQVESVSGTTERFFSQARLHSLTLTGSTDITLTAGLASNQSCVAQLRITGAFTFTFVGASRTYIELPNSDAYDGSKSNLFTVTAIQSGSVTTFIYQNQVES